MHMKTNTTNTTTPTHPPTHQRNKESLSTPTNMDHSRLPFLLGLACLCALLSPNAVAALGLPTPLHSHIKLGNDKCLAAPANVVNGDKLVVVNCADHDPADVRLHFVFDTNQDSVGEIKLFANQHLCVDVPTSQLNSSLQVWRCEGFHVNRQFRVVASPPRIHWQGSDQTKMWTLSGDRVVIANPSIDATTQGWEKVNSKPYPFVRIELDGNNKCLFASETHANGALLSTVVCSAFPPTDPRVRFVVDGALLRLYNDQNFCVHVPGGNPDTALEMRSCDAADVQLNGKFDIEDDYIRLQASTYRLTDIGNRAVVAAAGSVDDQTWTKMHSVAGQPSRIQLGDDKCMFAPRLSNFVLFEVVTCSDYNDTDERLQFVFAADNDEVGEIMLYGGNQSYCIDMTGLTNTPLHVISCSAPVGAINRQFRVISDPPAIQSQAGPSTYVFTLSGTNGTQVVVAPPRPQRNSQRWTSVNPTIKLLELDAGNVCAETPTDASGNRVVGQDALFAAKCDLNNINQQFIAHPNGVIEVNHGMQQSYLNGTICLGVLGGSLDDGAWLQTMPCPSASHHPNMAFTVDADAARIRWTAHPERVVGVDTTRTSKPKLGLYLDTEGDHTQTWQPSLGDAAVMIKSANNDLCLDRTFRARPCAVKPSNTCSRDSDASSTNANDQSFVLRNGDASTVAIMAADGGNHCAVLGPGDGKVMMHVWRCDEYNSNNYWFKVNATEQSIGSSYSNLVFTLENDVMAPGTLTVMESGTGRESQRWDVLPARNAKCMRHCLQDGGDGSCPALGVIGGGACSTGVCVEGLCGDEEGIYGKKAVCCGEHGIDRHCLNARANLGNVTTAGNWCMACTGNDDRGGLTGCSAPGALPRNGQLPTTDTHLRCSFDNADDNNVAAALSPGQPLNNDLTYLAMTGIAAKVGPSDLHTSFPNLKHLDLAGSGASGFLLDSDTVESWTQLEHLNVSECTKLCSDTPCFHLNLQAMASLRVLDMSSMGLSDATKLAALKTLTSLEELYLNDNALTSLPGNFFDNMVQLTKLRVLGNPISTTLPPEIYTRVPNFDCDVALGSTPATATASPTSIPTKSPTNTVQQPSAFPTSAPTRTPIATPAPTAPTSLPTSAPTTNPTTTAPTAPTSQPTSTAPSKSPTLAPTGPTSLPTSAPSTSPSTTTPTAPTSQPTSTAPSVQPTPSTDPRFAPSTSPTTMAPTAPTSQPTSTAPSVQPTPVKESTAPTTRSPSVAKAAAGDNTLVFALAGVAVVAIVIAIVAVVMMMKNKKADAAVAATLVRAESVTVANVVTDKLPKMSEEHL
jgi:hypothetical protein